jgi:hypothetical protein
MENENTKEISTSLTVEDIKVLAGLIEVCSARGVIRPAEFIPVGTLFNKLVSILQNTENK